MTLLSDGITRAILMRDTAFSFYLLSSISSDDENYIISSITFSIINMNYQIEMLIMISQSMISMI